MNIYEKKIQDHFYHPRHAGALMIPDFSSTIFHPSCGDRIQIMGKVADGHLIDVGFIGQGCMLSQAAASLLAQEVMHKSLVAIIALTAEDLKLLVGMPVGPIRFKCIELCLRALHEGIKNYYGGRGIVS